MTRKRRRRTPLEIAEDEMIDAAMTNYGKALTVMIKAHISGAPLAEEAQRTYPGDGDTMRKAEQLTRLLE